MFEGVPTYPDAGRFWDVVDKYKVTIFYTAPTAIRALMRQGEEWPNKHDLRQPAPAGLGRRADQPRGLDVVLRAHRQGALPDRGHLVADRDRRHPDHAAARRHTLKPGSATAPFFGVEPVVLRDDGTRVRPNEGGKLCIKKPWPGMMRTI